MTVLSGKDFNDQYPNTAFYKILNKNFKHNNFTYKHGLNIDHIPFNPTEWCLKGGLYFTELNKLPIWIYSDSGYIAKVTIPPEASVYIEPNSFKADKFVLDMNNKVLIQDFYIWTNEDLCKHAINQNACLLQFVLLQTDEICKLAVNKTPSALRYVKVQTDEICETAIKKDGFALQYVVSQTDNMCKLAVKQHVNALYHVKDKTFEICKLVL